MSNITSIREIPSKIKKVKVLDETPYADLDEVPPEEETEEEDIPVYHPEEVHSSYKNKDDDEK